MAKVVRMRSVQFTLIELLTVITIIIILAGMTLAAASYVQRRALIAKTRVMIQSIETAMTQYESEYGFFPQQTNPIADPTCLGLKLSMLDGMLKPNGKKYIDWLGLGFGAAPIVGSPPGVSACGAEKICQDAFEQPLFYRCPGTMNTTKFDIWSMGPDGEHGKKDAVAPNPNVVTSAQTTDETNDDITNWKRGM